MSTYKIGDFAVFSGHGVGQICDVQVDQKNPSPAAISYYVIKLRMNGVKCLVPINKADKLRPLSNAHDVDKCYTVLQNHQIVLDRSTWNRRSREYAEKIHTGSIIEIATVFRALKLLEKLKILSYGEKKMLEKCKDLLIDELYLCTGSDRKSIDNKIEACFSSGELVSSP